MSFLKFVAWRGSSQVRVRQNLLRLPAAAYCGASEPNGVDDWKFITPIQTGVIEQRVQNHLDDKPRPAPIGEEKKPFTMLLPPPNVTGNLHIGHALTVCIEDFMAKTAQLAGRRVHWIPGTDHAGIATQAVVERILHRKENLLRKDMGRAEFVDVAKQWSQARRETIRTQLRAFGLSLDWSQEFFTLDDHHTSAVNEAFLRMHEAGLLYRANRMVNWCPTLQTALSDVEVDSQSITKPTVMNINGFKVEYGAIHDIAFPLVDEAGTVHKDQEICVATTRPETMFGDVAVAVHPDDGRYQMFIGRSVLNPATGHVVPVIADGVLADPTKGTGAVKVTPAHDANDYECAQRHNLRVVDVIGNDGTMLDTDLVPQRYRGKNRLDIRRSLLKELSSKNFVRGKHQHDMVVKTCSRTGDVIESLLRPQWYISMTTMAEQLKKAVEMGTIQIRPERCASELLTMLANIEDWCISRQLWWGHQIPAFRALPISEDATTATDEWIIAGSVEEAQAKLKKRYPHDYAEYRLERDEDVLDTWFSSALLPISTAGWPHEAQNGQELKQTGLYPNTVLETGHDIIFFWVARMLMTNHFLVDEYPFTQIWCHSMVRDSEGRKMSKSKGNVIDPMDVIQGASQEALKKRLLESNVEHGEVAKGLKAIDRNYPNGFPAYGADALRLALLGYSEVSTVNFDMRQAKNNSAFLNKIYNATKYVQQTLMDTSLGSDIREAWTEERYVQEGEKTLALLDDCSVHPANRYFIYELMSLAQDLDYSELKPTEVTPGVYFTAVRKFWVEMFANDYMEQTKYLLGNGDDKGRAHVARTLRFAIETLLRLSYPIAPFHTIYMHHVLNGCEDPNGNGDAQVCAINRVRHPCFAEATRATGQKVSEELLGPMIDARNLKRSIRRLKDVLGIASSEVKNIIVLCGTIEAASEANFVAMLPVIGAMGRADLSVDINPPSATREEVIGKLGDGIIMPVSSDYSLFLTKDQVNNAERVAANLERRLTKASREWTSRNNVLRGPGSAYIPQATAQVKEEELQRLGIELEQLRGLYKELTGEEPKVQTKTWPSEKSRRRARR
eukprot:Clim_evm95s243 gene=Clim_evmTU95s243